jgi:hypothetical protein
MQTVYFAVVFPYQRLHVDLCKLDLYKRQGNAKNIATMKNHYERKSRLFQRSFRKKKTETLKK